MKTTFKELLDAQCLTQTSALMNALESDISLSKLHELTTAALAECQLLNLAIDEVMIYINSYDDFSIGTHYNGTADVAISSLPKEYADKVKIDRLSKKKNQLRLDIIVINKQLKKLNDEQLTITTNTEKEIYKLKKNFELNIDKLNVALASAKATSSVDALNAKIELLTQKCADVVKQKNQEISNKLATLTDEITRLEAKRIKTDAQIEEINTLLSQFN